MEVAKIREIAKNYDIKTSRMSKVKMIQSIQISEENFDCFSSAVDGICNQDNCLWREDCFGAAKNTITQ